MINFNILTFRREYALPLFMHFVKKMKPENKAQIVVSILAFGNMNRFGPMLNDLAASGVQARAVGFNSEYLEKPQWAVQQTEFEYSAKIDEDVHVSEHTLDFIVENIKMLDDPQNLCISPVVSNGIPTTEMFLEQFATKEQRDAVHSMFLKTEMKPIWGCSEYPVLNRHTIGATEWKPEEFYASVAQMHHFYKGIHPLRVSAEAQLAIDVMILGDTGRFFAKQEYEMVKSQYPYLCNNMFFIRTDKWRRIIEDRTLYVDPFDEVPLSKYKQASGENWLFVKNGWSTHFAWNTVYWYPDMEKREQIFVEELKRKVI